jgi:enamine deaminase RidA (YjgF/YER057c/UK114 family)
MPDPSPTARHASRSGNLLDSPHPKAQRPGDPFALQQESLMPRQLISSGSPFEAQVGYSRAVVQGDWCFVAGTTGADPVTKTMPDDVVEQGRNALTIIGKALEDAGFSFADVVRVTYYITDATYWDVMGDIAGPVFGDIRPAASCVVAGLIKPNMKIEIEVTAFKG